MDWLNQQHTFTWYSDPNLQVQTKLTINGKTFQFHFQIQYVSYYLKKPCRTLLVTDQGNESPRRLVVEKLETVAFQVEDCTNEHEEQGEG